MASSEGLGEQLNEAAVSSRGESLHVRKITDLGMEKRKLRWIVSVGDNCFFDGAEVQKEAVSPS